MIEKNLKTKTILLRFGDYIIWAVPPALLVFFINNQLASLNKLAWFKIYGTSGEKLSEAGQIKMVCFDKTGTLTKLELDIVGIHDVEDFHALKETATIMKGGENYCKEIYKIMASCHGVILIDEKLNGEPLELEMIKLSQWGIEKSDDRSIRFNFLLLYI